MKPNITIVSTSKHVQSQRRRPTLNALINRMILILFWFAYLCTLEFIMWLVSGSELLAWAAQEWRMVVSSPILLVIIFILLVKSPPKGLKITPIVILIILMTFIRFEEFMLIITHPSVISSSVPSLRVTSFAFGIVFLTLCILKNTRSWRQ